MDSFSDLSPSHAFLSGLALFSFLGTSLYKFHH